MTFICCWCREKKEGYPTGSFTRVFDGKVPQGPTQTPLPTYVNIGGNKSLCDKCMTDPACTGEAMVKRLRARDAGKTA